MPGIRRFGRAFVALSLAAAALAVTSPAHAANTPWRFHSLTYSETGLAAGDTAARSATCDAGYSLVGGGFRTSSTEVEVFGQYRDGINPNKYVVVFHSYSASPMSVAVYPICAWATDVGTITKRETDVAPSGGYAGGQANCDSGSRALFGGADWNGGGPNRRIDVAAPSTSGSAWAVSGENPGSDTYALHVEAYCVPATVLGAYSAPRTQSQNFANPGAFNIPVNCPSGTRSVSGGALSGPTNGPLDLTTYHADIYRSYPTSSTSWQVSGKLNGGTLLTWITWCIPASQPVATLTSKPPSLDNHSTVTFGHSYSDPTGEPLTNQLCYVDGQSSSCGLNSTQVNGLTDGSHTFIYEVTNTSGQKDQDSYTWTVDLTTPLLNHPAAFPLSGAVPFTFSEPVNGVTTSTLQVNVQGQPTPLPGSLTMNPAKTQASWLPAAPLVPGESYVVTASSTIKDLAGNPVSSLPSLAYGSLAVESSATQLVRTWDPDASTSASGGSYISSRTVGSSATWTFPATSGQRATVYGVRLPMGGYASVYVDGVKQGKASFYASALKHKVPVFTTPALSAGTHKVEVRLLGTKPAVSNGSWVGLDFLRIGGVNRQETVTTQKFRRLTSASASGGSYDSVPHRTSGDTGGPPAYTLTFHGSGIKLYATQTPASGSAKVYVDGVLKATVNLRSSSAAFQALVATIVELPDALHVLRIVPVGTSAGSGSDVNLDRVDVHRTFS
jgi:hypothetical protein